MGNTGEKFNLRLRLLREIEIKDPKKDPGKRDAVMKRNLSYVYERLFSHLYGGRVIQPGDGEKYKLMYGMIKDFTPDVTDFGFFGNIWTEVKATSGHSKRPFFTEEQVEKYPFYLLDAMDNGQINPDSRVAIFTYGGRMQKAGLVQLNNNSLRKKVAEETRNLVVFPWNLLFSIFRDLQMCSKPQLDHLTSESSYNYQKYWMFKVRTMNRLNAGDLEYFVNGVKKLKKWDRFATENILHLDDLVVEHSLFPENISLGKYEINPFSIVEYKNKNPHVWLDSFWKNHQYILEEGLEVDDIFSMSDKDRIERLRELGYFEHQRVIGEENGKLVTNGDVFVKEDLPF